MLSPPNLIGKKRAAAGHRRKGSSKGSASPSPRRKAARPAPASSASSAKATSSSTSSIAPAAWAARAATRCGPSRPNCSESLKNLDTVHQFQIIFYNERPVVFNPTGTPGRLAFATEQNKQRAVRFIDSITADGGTAHEDALKLAIRLQPDVIFFLTDADDPKLTPAQLEKIRHLAAGIIINAIEFGPGPKPAGDSFLAELARQNGGGYAYVDISKRGERAAAGDK